MSLAFTKCYTAYSEPTGLAASALGFDTKTLLLSAFWDQWDFQLALRQKMSYFCKFPAP